MPQQETFFAKEKGGLRIEVLKTYDQNYAREAFADMDEAAQMHLWNALGVAENYDVSDLPAREDPDSGGFLWEELLDAAREDGNLLSFFVVNESKGTISERLYVSPDWPSAE